MALGLVTAGSLSWLACASVPTFSEGKNDSGMRADANEGDGAPAVDAATKDATPTNDARFEASGPRPKHVLFVTAGLQFYNFGGATPEASANQFCATSASNAGYVNGNWIALLWHADGISPAAKVKASPDGWYQALGNGMTGTQVLTSLTDAGRTSEPILTEYGQLLTNVLVWTGGTLTEKARNCLDWTTATDSAHFGRLDAVGAGWLNDGAILCNAKPLPIYCIQQPP